MVYFTGDTHFFHTNIIKYCNRPFDNVDSMNEMLIQNWNKIVKPEDLIYHLGDFGTGPEKCLLPVFKRLNGKKHLIKGSHDSKYVLGLPWESINDIKVLHLESKRMAVVLCHYAMRTWYKSHYGTWMLFGHSHGKVAPFGKSFDVGVDCWNFTPISLDKVEKEMNKLSNNFNLIVKGNV